MEEEMVVVTAEVAMAEAMVVAVMAKGEVERAVEAKGVGVKTGSGMGTLEAGMDEAKVVEGTVAAAMDWVVTAEVAMAETMVAVTAEVAMAEAMVVAVMAETGRVEAGSVVGARGEVERAERAREAVVKEED